MADKLADICAAKREAVAAAKAMRPLREVEAEARAQPAPRGFAAALDAAVGAGRYGLIAEIKRASPSAGMIRPDFDPAALAGAYRAGGASCLSVLTDAPDFQGAPAHLIAARESAPMPVLRKDFLVDPWQIAESRAIGADCVLLILAVLADGEAAAMEAQAMELGMDVLLEVHDEAELERALRLRSPLVGVNNRNLKTLTTDLATTERLAALLPGDRVLVAESGLKTAADLARMARVGARRFLIGESLLRHADVAAATGALLAQPVPA